MYEYSQAFSWASEPTVVGALASPRYGLVGAQACGVAAA